MGLGAFQRPGVLVPQESRQPLYFTSVRWKDSRLELWERHLHRLEKSFLELGVSVRETQNALESLQQWAESFTHEKELALRIECDLKQDTKADFRVHKRDLNLKALPNKVKLLFLPVKTAQYPGGELKVWDYESIFQDLEAAQNQGFHDLVYVQQDGRLLDASTSNICLVKNSVFYADLPGPGILRGLYLEKFLEVAQCLGHKVKREHLYQSDLKGADALFLTNCLKGVRLAEGMEKSYDDSLLWKGRLDQIERLMHE